MNPLAKLAQILSDLKNELVLEPRRQFSIHLTVFLPSGHHPSFIQPGSIHLVSNLCSALCLAPGTDQGRKARPLLSQTLRNKGDNRQFKKQRIPHWVPGSRGRTLSTCLKP